jgi:hypothetical protein
MDSDHPRAFFVHVMKTGGTSLLNNATRNVGRGRMRPGTEPADFVEAVARYTSVTALAALPAATRDQIDFFAAHVPYEAHRVVGEGLLTLSVLREPVGRTVSYLQQCARLNPEHAGWPLEAIYEDEWFHVRFVRNHQTKVFSMTLAESLRPPVVDEPADPTVASARLWLELAGGALNHPIVVDDARFAVALDNLAAVDLLGVHEGYDDFLGLVERRLGWDIDRAERAREGRPVEVSPAFARRITEDNAYDVELHRRAAELGTDRAARAG